MNEVISVYGTDLEIKEYMGRRVVTFNDIDAVHQRPSGTARKRFNDNRKHFINCVDFFKIKQPSEIRTLGIERPQGGLPQEVTLITETGYLMLVKSFTDDLAWEVQRKLVSSYFRAKEIIEEEQNISDDAEITTDQFIRISEIVGNCSENNTPYVLNVLRHIIPDIDAVVDKKKQSEYVEPVEQTTEVSVNIKQKPFYRNGVSIDIDKLKMTMKIKHISEESIAEKMDVSVRSVYNWLSGRTKPVIENRIKLCMALGEDENYLTPKRKRNVRKD